MLQYANEYDTATSVRIDVVIDATVGCDINSCDTTVAGHAVASDDAVAAIFVLQRVFQMLLREFVVRPERTETAVATLPERND
jgi:hypothetical protein